MEWPKEISKFFSRQRLASISLGFQVIKISSLGEFFKNVEILLGGCLTVRISGSYSQEMMGLVLWGSFL